MMRCRIVIPIKAPALCKTRLAPAVGEAERQAVVAYMLQRTVSAAIAVAGRDQVFLLGPSRHGLDQHIRLLPDPGQGLNHALAAARDAAVEADVARLLFLSADLPFVTADDVAALVKGPASAILAAPDDAGRGTNAISLPLPDAADFRFRYGEDSFAAHQAEADRLGLRFVPVARAGLTFDIDTPQDLSRWRQGN